MEIGIGLPNATKGVTGEQLLEWARRADAAGFSSLGTIDRIAYPNFEPIASLAAAAAVTERIRLATTILIAPLRVNSVLLAKQAASVHRLSGGRMVLGLAVGPREDDYDVSDREFGERGQAFDEMLPQIRRTWEESGREYAPGPDVSADPPQLLIGGSVERAYQRTAQYGDGWIMGGGAPDQFAAGREKALAAWRDADRDGEPKTASLAYFALGDDPEGDAKATVGHYYAWLGEIGDAIVGSVAKGEDMVKGYIEAFTEAGCDELVMFPSSPDPAQVDLLAEVALSGA